MHSTTSIIVYVLMQYALIIVTRHEKTRLMYTKYIHPYYFTYLLFYTRYSQPVSCMRFLINGCINDVNFVRLLCLHKKLFNFKIQNVVKFCVHIRPIFSDDAGSQLHFDNGKTSYRFAHPYMHACACMLKLKSLGCCNNHLIAMSL